MSPWKDQHHLLRSRVFVNCWQMAPFESAAMWRLYCQPRESLAVRSTVGRLTEALAAAPQRVFLATVKYGEPPFYSKDTVLQPFVHKRINYSDERELRAMATAFDVEMDPELPYSAYVDEFEAKADGGVYVPADLATLVETLVIAPDAPQWFERLLRSTLKCYDLDLPIKRSRLADPPLPL